MIYSKLLEKVIEKTGSIPRKLVPCETLKAYRRYYIPEADLFFKVLDLVTINDFLYLEIRDNRDLYSMICSPSDDTTVYEMYVTDKYNLRETENIINTGESYMGYEIQYWFWYHKIDLNSERYKKFNSYIDITSLNTINPNKMYSVYANEDDGIYYDIRFVNKRRENR